MKETTYRFRNEDGTESDVLSVERLIQCARSGILAEETPVREEASDRWQPAWRVPVLQGVFDLASAAPPLVPPSPPAPPAALPGPAPFPGPLPYPGVPPHGALACAAPYPGAPFAPPAAAPRRAGFPVGIAVVVTAVVLAFVLFVSVPAMLARAARKQVTTRDGQLRVTLPMGWTATPTDPAEELSANADGDRSAVIIARTESYATLDEVDAACFERTVSVTSDFEDHGVRRFTSHGLPFVQHKFSGRISGSRCTGFVTTTSVGGSYYRIAAFTTPELAFLRERDLAEIIRSIEPSRR